MNDNLVRAALAVRQNALAPFSRFLVGAALQSDNGVIYAGCNVESASYGLTLCAERNAAFHAIAQGARTFVHLVVAADTETLTPPCGACRQVLWELCGDIPITLVNLAGASETHQLRDLLPKAFDATFLG